MAEIDDDGLTFAITPTDSTHLISGYLARTEFRSNALIIENETSLEDWTEMMRQVGRFKDAYQWYIGDALVYYERAWGDRYDDIIHATSKNYKTLRNYKYVAAQIPPDDRVEGVPWSHHMFTAALSREERAPILKACKPDRPGDLPKFSRREIEEMVREVRRKRAPREDSALADFYTRSQPEGSQEKDAHETIPSSGSATSITSAVPAGSPVIQPPSSDSVQQPVAPPSQEIVMAPVHAPVAAAGPYTVPRFVQLAREHLSDEQVGDLIIALYLDLEKSFEARAMQLAQIEEMFESRVRDRSAVSQPETEGGDVFVVDNKRYYFRTPGESRMADLLLKILNTDDARKRRLAYENYMTARKRQSFPASRVEKTLGFTPADLLKRVESAESVQD